MKPTANEVAEILASQIADTVHWHASAHPLHRTFTEGGLAQLVRQQHHSNAELWHLEDDARSGTASDTVIAAIKRSIDTVNQRRNNQIESIDEHLITCFANPSDVPLNSETPGSVFDRLSINALKIFHMQEQVERPDASPAHVHNCQARVQLLKEQRQDLSLCLQRLIEDLSAGTKRLKVYRQVKMYNDPNLNPVLLREKSQGSH